MCKYCEGETALHDSRNTLSRKTEEGCSGIDIWVGPKTLDITAVSDTYEPCVQEVSIPIRFCPVCGKEL